MIVITGSEYETYLEGKKLGHTLKPGDTVAMHGPLGSGKTVFTRGIAAGLEIDAFVTSPTFTVVNEYSAVPPLFHFDLYRFDNEDELLDIGWDDYLERGGICVVEWSEKAANAMPPESVNVHIEILDVNNRKITIC